MLYLAIHGVMEALVLPLRDSHRSRGCDHHCVDYPPRGADWVELLVLLLLSPLQAAIRIRRWRYKRTWWTINQCVLPQSSNIIPAILVFALSGKNIKLINLFNSSVFRQFFYSLIFLLALPFVERNFPRVLSNCILGISFIFQPLFLKCRLSPPLYT